MADDSAGDFSSPDSRSRRWLNQAGSASQSARSGIVNRVRAIGHRIRNAVIGSPERYSIRILVFLLLVSTLVTFIGLFLLIGENMDPTASSGPLLRTVVGFMTNFFFYSLLAVVGAIVAVNRWWDRAAKLTAKETRYSKQTVKRLSAEVKSTDGSVRLIGNADHSFNQLRAKLMRAFAGQHESERPGEDVAVSDSDPETTEKALQGDPRTASLPDAERLGSDDAQTESEAHSHTDGAVDGAGDDIAADLLRARTNAQVIGAVSKVHGYNPEPTHPADTTLVQNAVERDPTLELTDDGDLVRHPEPETTSRLAVVDEADRPLPAPVEADSSDESSDVDDSDGSSSSTTEQTAASFRQAIQTFRMDMASSLNFDEILWRFIVPALGVVWAIFIVARTPWFAPWVYFVIGGVACLVGTISYGTFKWRRRRKLSSLRVERDPEQWDTCAVLAKRVETPEQTMFVAWMAGNVYADFDKQRLVETVADRWHQRLHRNRVAPAMQQKFAREIKHMRPLLTQFERSNPHEGHKAIEDDIIDVIESAKDPDGLVAKRQLCERVVERGEGVGHDPDIVAEVYEDLIPFVLSETDIEVTDTDGQKQTITAVHLRWMDLPDDLAQIRAQFANHFSADDEAVFDLPDVDAERPSRATWPPIAEAGMT